MLTTMDRLTNRRVDLSLLQERLRKRRETIGVDQESLADRAGVSAAYVSRLERGAVPNPKVFDLERVAAALNTTVSDLLRPLGDEPDAARMAECVELMRQLDGEPPEVVETVMRWWRDSVAILARRQQQTTSTD